MRKKIYNRSNASIHPLLRKQQPQPQPQSQFPFDSMYPCSTEYINKINSLQKQLSELQILYDNKIIKEEVVKEEVVSIVDDEKPTKPFFKKR